MYLLLSSGQKTIHLSPVGPGDVPGLCRSVQVLLAAWHSTCFVVLLARPCLLKFCSLLCGVRSGAVAAPESD